MNSVEVLCAKQIDNVTKYYEQLRPIWQGLINERIAKREAGFKSEQQEFDLNSNIRGQIVVISETLQFMYSYEYFLYFVCIYKSNFHLLFL